MGIKRPLAEVDPQVADEGPDLPLHDTKRRKQFGKGRHKAKEGTSEFAKKRARNIERLLQRQQDLPANVRNDLERELAARKADVADKAFHKKRGAMISKYHMVRFFERQKASRLVRQLKHKIEQSPGSDDINRLKQDLHVAEVDEAYTLYHPHIEPYISLYGNPKSAKEGEDANKAPAAKSALEAQRPPMWAVVEQAMQEGSEALRRLRERRSAGKRRVEHRPKRPPPKASGSASNVAHEQQQQQNVEMRQKGGKASAADRKPDAQQQLNRRERRKLMQQATPAADSSDDDSDGGFFEEL